ncbi:nitrate- and nitrite sensing domain-containing protein [Streptomyces sp. PKU-EA00015]|uniref:sensor histidine kinase n=1 Tax=Streptomyces sp. PKU-EA00015 TaxID=2748326 RepID=UPI0015A05412|nr:nitrate- and nitrite sensing domain-containing protein [Streptomyces sp. PKU-EA00015]NWF24987.1 nitrate- and nitrite sensing domain-containing protein [Streptomyces sp. PKU-EA00015]
MTPSGRRARVRSRLVAGVAVVGLVVVGAGAPGVLATSAELTEAQRLVTLAELDRQAVTLAHSLADERDEVTAYVAAGRDSANDGAAGDGDGEAADTPKLSATLSARVDRQIREIRAAVPDDHADLRRALASLPGVRRTALTGTGTPLEVHRAYTAVINRLQALADELAEKTPPRAAEATRAPAALGLAVEQASAARGLLLAALSVPRPETRVTYDPATGLPVQTAAEDSGADARTRNELTAAAQQARVRELAALADFDQAAGKDARDNLAATVTGPEVKAAESFLARLTDQPRLSASERGTDRSELEAALTARIEQMRGAETALAADRLVRIEHLRDDDVTALEVRIALLGGLLVVTIGVLAAVSRTLTRPLAVLRIGAARLAESPETEEPVRFTGRNDEFAQVVRSLNSLHGTLRDLGARVRHLDAERGGLTGSAEALATELAEVRTELGERAEELTTELQRLRHTVHHTFVNLSLRTLGLVERQLGVIEKLEEREQDPERLATLFKLDHMATVMRRHSENLLVLAGAEHGQGHVGPVPLVDVLRAAVSEIERYDRVVIQSLPPHAQVAGFAADDLSHLVAELLENATSFSPPDAQVEMSGWLLESGEVMLSVQDAGIGMTEARIEELNARLKNPETYESDAGRETEGLGLRVAALLAARHRVRIQLREHKQGGITAVVVVPAALLPDGPPATASQQTPVPGAGPALTLPGSAAEANSNTLPPSARRPAQPEGTSAADGGRASHAERSADADAPTPDADHASGAGQAAPAGSASLGAHGAPVADAAPAAPADATPAPHADRGADASSSGLASLADPFAAAVAPYADGGAGADHAASSPDPASPANSFAAAEAADAERASGAGQADPAGSASLADPFAAAVAPYADGAPAGPFAAAEAADADHASPVADGTTAPGAHAEPVADVVHGAPVEPFLPADPFVEAAERAVRAAEGERDAHERTADGEPQDIEEETFAMRLPEQPADDVTSERVTDKGLPKRTPKIVAPPTAPAGRTGSVDAEALRRRLGGFHRGAQEGRRDAEAEIAQSGTQQATRATDEQNTDTETGDTVEEARS